MTMPTRTFTRDELDELNVAWGGKHNVHVEQVDEGRWQVHYSVVFRAPDDGRLWEVGFQRGATEMQECDRWYDEQEITATEVEPYVVEVTKYRPTV